MSSYNYSGKVKLSLIYCLSTYLIVGWLTFILCPLHVYATTPDPLDLRDAGYSKQGTVEDLIKIRCGTAGEDAWTLWTGEIYAYVPKDGFFMRLKKQIQRTNPISFRFSLEPSFERV